MNEIDFLLSIDSKKIKYGLSRTIALLDACNNPQDKLNIIQIVGTNGKGSTSAMIANVLINNNYKIGLFTSPHLVYINERIRINGIAISDDAYQSLDDKSILSQDMGYIKMKNIQKPMLIHNIYLWLYYD